MTGMKAIPLYLRYLDKRLEIVMRFSVLFYFRLSRAFKILFAKLFKFCLPFSLLCVLCISFTFSSSTPTI
jgi:hypothetical protein